MYYSKDGSLNNDLKICFVTAASPTDGFFSQIGMFRLSLNSLEGMYKNADIILSLGDDKIVDVPDRWVNYFSEGIKLHWADPMQFQKIGQRAQGDNKWKYNYNAYDLVVFFDADTMLIKPIDELLYLTKEKNAVSGVIAHYPFPHDKDQKTSDLWHFFAKKFTGKDIQLNYTHSLLKTYEQDRLFDIYHGTSKNRGLFPSKMWSWINQIGTTREIYKESQDNNANCPFYLNFGFVVMTPKVLMTIRESYLDLRSKIAPFLKIPIFSGQIALTLAIHKHDVPTHSASIKYNFPNDPIAEELYPDQLKKISVIHYLRTQKFDRQKIFATEEAFNEFLFLKLEGSNKIFQNYVWNLTKGKYPFPKYYLPEKPQQIHNISKIQDKINYSQKELIVVLGMHRSGTSAITRGLRTLGVDLGEKLIPPIAGNNDKGFWEDQDINALNQEMLYALNKDWHFLSPVNLSDVNSLRRDGYMMRAIELIKEKTSGVQFFGFKDPRTTKLLPFWKEVFVQSQFKVNYVITLRHPLSVCQSLYKRDGFEIEKGSLLWLEHIISSLVGTIGEQRIVVDFDRLMQAPDVELRRIAKKFKLQIIPSELIRYKTEFLDNKLRHSVYVIDDMISEEALSLLAQEVYTCTLEVAMDEEDVDADSFETKISQWYNERSRQMPALVLADKLASLIDIKNKEIREISDQLAERNIELREITSSKAWRIAMLLRDMRVFLIPPNSLRSKFVRNILTNFFEIFAKKTK